MNTDNSEKYLILLILCIIIFFIIENNKNNLNNNNLNNNLNETFQNETKIIDENIMTNISDNNYSIFESSIYEKYFKINKKYVCNLLPYMTNNKLFKCDGGDGGGDDKLIPTPKHIIKLSNKSQGKYLAVFNDGQLYEKSRIRDKFWKGPLSNSMPDNKYLRMITLDNYDNLLGITQDGNMYIKKVNENNKRNRYDNKWEQLPGLGVPLIYIINEMKNVDDNLDNSSSNINILLGLDYSGLIIKIEYNPELGIISYERLANDITPVIKLYYDKNGYLIGLNKDLHLIRKETTNYEESVFNLNKINPSDVLDIIYDKDGKMFGLVPIINNDNGGFNTLMKQNLVNYQSKFLPLALTDIKNDDIKNIYLTDNDIIKLKTGVNFDIETELKSKDYGYKNIQEAMERTDIEDITKLRQLCSERTYPDDNVEYANFELLNRMESQQLKINELNNVVLKLQDTYFNEVNDKKRTKLQ